MTIVLERDFAGTADNIAAAEMYRVQNAPLYTATTPDPAGFFETAGLMYQQETVIGSALTYGFSPDRVQGNYSYDKTFNPYRYHFENADTMEDAMPWVRTGLFHDVVSEDQFQDRLGRLREEAENRKRLAESDSVLGLIAGMGLSLLDVATLVPIGGWLSKGKTIAKGAKYALAGATFTGAQEVVLHMQQDLRTQKESLFNIAAGAVLAGGIGLFVGARQPGNLLHPRSANYIFKPENKLRVSLGTVGSRLKDNPIVEPAVKAGRASVKFAADTSVGAKAVEAGQLVKSAGATTLAKVTPVGYLMSAKAKSARDFAVKMMDTGGLLTDQMATGQAARSFEDEKTTIMSLFEDTFVSSVDSFYALRMELERITGGVQSRLVQDLGDTARGVGRFFSQTLGRDVEHPTGTHFEDFEWQDITYRALHDDIDEGTLDNLKSRFGDEGAELIVTKAKEQAELIHTANQEMEDLMVKSGMIQESQRMGREYGLAQLWNPKGFAANPKAAVAFFIKKLINDPDAEWLNTNFGMTLEEFNKLGKETVTIKGNVDDDVTYTPESGLDHRVEILEDWSGNTYDRSVMEAELAVEQAEAAYQTARREAVLAGRDLRTSETDYRKSTVAEARAILKKRVAERERTQANREKLALEKRAIDTELRRLEEEQRVRMNQYHDTGKWQRKYRSERTSQVEETEDLLKSLEKEQAPYADIDEARKMLTEADAEIARIGPDALNAAVLDARQKPVYSRALSKLKERQNNINREINKLDRRLARLDPKTEKLDAMVQAARQAVVARRQTRVALRQIKKEADKASSKARRQAKSARKSARRTEARLPVHLYAEQLVQRLSKQTQMPRGILDTEVFVSGRAKSRKIILTNEERREAIELGLLRDDLYGVMYHGYDDVASRIALRKNFGSEGPDDVLRSIRDEYDSLLANARSRNLTPRYIRQLEREKRGALSRAEGVWNRALGRYGLPQDPDGFLHWSTGTLRAWNYVMYGSGFLLTSLTDLASVALTTGFHTLSVKHMSALSKTMKGMKNEEIRRLSVALERILHNSRTLKINDVGDLKDMAGIGELGSITHNTTSAITRVVQGLSNTASVISGMTWWNTRLKALAMIEMQHNLVGIMRQYPDLLRQASAGSKKAQVEISKLASIGIGAEQAGRIARMMAKHEPQNIDGLFELDMHRWLDEGDAGNLAYQDVLTALRKTANRAVMTPGIGDTPLLMSTTMGKTILQFQTYGFVSVNRFVAPALQRANPMTYGDMESVLSMAFAAGLGSGVVVGKDLLRDGTVRDRSPGAWAYDILDRSGYLMYLTVPSAALYRTASYYIGASERPSRYSQSSNVMSLLAGPSGNLLYNLGGLGTDAVYGDMEGVKKTALKLAPFQILKQVSEKIAGD